MPINEQLIESDYLCNSCKQLKYIDVKTKLEYCINTQCVLCAPFSIATDDSRFKEDLRRKEIALKLQSKQYDFLALAEYVYRKRADLIKKAFSGRANMEEVLLCDEILLYLSNSPPVGRLKTKEKLDDFIRSYNDHFKTANMLEDIQNKRFVISSDGKYTLALKYWDVILDMYKNYGFASANIGEGLFKYQKIDEQKIIRITPRIGMEFSKFFQQNFRLIIGISYILKQHYRTSLNYKYDPTPIDLAALLGLYRSVKNDTTWNSRGIKNHYENTCKYSGVTPDFSGFVQKYSTTSSPLTFKYKDYFLVDKHTIMFYLLYLFSIDTKRAPSQPLSGSEIIGQAKQWASDTFEEECRNKVSENGYSVYPKELKAENDLGYDIIGVSEKLKQIIIGEAKYRDFAPSSITGTTFLRQEIYPDTDEGLYGRILRHIERVETFKDRFSWFKSKLGIQGDITDYSIIPVIINKFKPLIKKYDNIFIIDV